MELNGSGVGGGGSDLKSRAFPVVVRYMQPLAYLE